MNAVVQAIRRRERARKFWRSLTWVSTIGCVASFLYAVFGSVLILISVLASSTSLIVSGLVTVGIGTAGGVLLSLGHKPSKRKFCNSGDPQFGSQTYHFLLKSLSAMGIKDAAVYLGTHPENAAAYKEVHYEYLSALKHQFIPSTGKAVTDLICHNARQVALMVYPGTKELARTQPLLNLIKERGIIDPDMLRELVDAIDESPLALSDGAL